LRVRVLVAFAASFMTGTVVIFAAAALAGFALRTAGVPMTWRLGSAAAIFIALAVVDVRAIRRKAYCPIGRWRQTPQRMDPRVGPTISAAVWGFDTGVIVTTFRVAAITWAAFSMTALGLSPWWIGIAYGLAFVLPMLFLLITQTADSESLHRALGTRPLLQSCSAIALIASAACLLVS
jgi:hypothetical protein